MQKDTTTMRDTGMTGEGMQDRNITDGSSHQGDRGTPTMQRSRTERGEISNEAIDDDAMIDETTTRGDLGAGE
jgi:hypothetical protein